MDENLKKEAEEYADLQLKGIVDKVSKFECINDFTAGALSNYVEKQKLEFAIEQLKQCTYLPKSDWEFSVIGRKIKELEEKLSEL